MRPLTASERLSLLRELTLGRRLLKRSPYLSRDEMQSWQLERIRELVSIAYRSVPLYRERYRAAGFEPGDLKTWGDFHALPLISKDDLIEHYPERTLSTDVNRDALITSRSSGSSGKVLDLAYSAETMIAYILATLRVYQMGFRYRPWHRHVYVYTSRYPFDSVFGLYPLIFVSTLDPVEQILGVLVRERPHLVVCYPSHLRQIADLASDEQIASIRPTLISVSSEMSSQSERDHLAEVFGCPALDNYSSEELARIAAQCPHKIYHLFEDMNFVETLDERGNPTAEVGRIVGTNLHNRAMPLIRYQQDDLAQITNERCACGWNFRTLRSIQGRRNDAFILPSGRVLTSGFLLDATYEFLLEHRSAVRDFSLVQESSRSIRLELVPGRNLSAAIQARIAHRFREFLESDVEFRIEVVQECERTRTGKRNPIIRYAGRAGDAAAEQLTALPKVRG